MPTPTASVLPFRIEDGWPVALPGCRVTLRETGILLGSLSFDNQEWAGLNQHRIQSIRIDDHSATDGWTTRQSDGSDETNEFTVPMSPVGAPSGALGTPRAFEEWVMDVHGGSGRLLVWDETFTWWCVQDPSLEIMLTCAPAGRFSPNSDELSWRSFGSESGLRTIDKLRTRFEIEVPK